ncbi:MAG: carbonate dehydratase [Verrucomicrobiae bacterium]|nr:carbonate dehydratase [Verrucomicrobiae bacterium]
MRTLQSLLVNNQKWARQMEARQPGFFATLARQQRPKFLWIGCADSRVPANEITGLLPGEMFVHRNIANVVAPSDMNSLAVIQFAVEVLKVEHIIVCGHYGCGGVQAALRGDRLGLVDHWLRQVRQVAEQHQARLAALPDDAAKVLRLCELNVLEQALHVSQCPVVQDAWQRGQVLSVHAWIYALEDGLLRDLGYCVTRSDEVGPWHATALAAADQRPAGQPAPVPPLDLGAP